MPQFFNAICKLHNGNVIKYRNVTNVVSLVNWCATNRNPQSIIIYLKGHFRNAATARKAANPKHQDWVYYWLPETGLVSKEEHERRKQSKR